MAPTMMLVMPAIGILWGVGLVVYRVFLSPLAKFPGRKLAAWTMWYEFYYQAVKGGQYPWEIQKMHEEYGRKSLKAIKERVLTDIFKGQSFESIPMSYISTIRTITTSFIASNRSTSTNGTPGSSVTPTRPQTPRSTSCTNCVRQQLLRTSSVAWSFD